MFRKIALVGVTALAFAGVLSGCSVGDFTMIEGSGNKITEVRQVSGFTSIELSGVGKVIVKQTGTESLTVEGDDNIVPKIKTEVSGGKLNIKLENNTNVNPKTPLIFNVTVKDLQSIDLSGAGEIEANDLQATNITFNMSGAGKGSLGNLTADSLKSTLSGVGNITISGKVQKQDVELSGAGSYNAENLQSQDATVQTSGVGSATVWATNTLNAKVSGAGSIRYYGSPTVREEKSGSGNISKIGDK